MIRFPATAMIRKREQNEREFKMKTAWHGNCCGSNWWLKRPANAVFHVFFWVILNDQAYGVDLRNSTSEGLLDISDARRK